jgi:putative colanic acid biosynthesis UDP-glucose lipid carrier transferase
MPVKTTLLPAALIAPVHTKRKSFPFVYKKFRECLEENNNYLVKKRIFDIVFSVFVILFLLSWLLPILALMIKLTSQGPVFFIQKRVGFLGKSFYCIKLRTMVVNKYSDTAQATVNDPRITRFGAFLRNSNLDELPQFFNVLMGNMSIIGPRPHMHKDCIDFDEMVGSSRFRYLLKPGITGLAQIKGCRGPAKDFDSVFRRYQWDGFYIRNISFALDMRILANTLFSTIHIIVSRLAIAREWRGRLVYRLTSFLY